MSIDDDAGYDDAGDEYADVDTDRDDDDDGCDSSGDDDDAD